jgi:hypothetical protein
MEGAASSWGAADLDAREGHGAGAPVGIGDAQAPVAFEAMDRAELPAGAIGPAEAHLLAGPQAERLER